MHKGVIFVICLLVYPQLKSGMEISVNIAYGKEKEGRCGGRKSIWGKERSRMMKIAWLLILQIHKPTDTSCSRSLWYSPIWSARSLSLTETHVKVSFPYILSATFIHIFYIVLFPWRIEMKSLSDVWLFVTPMDCSLPDSSIHGIFHARILEWVAISFSRDLPSPWIEPRSPELQAESLPSEPP